MVSKNVIFLFLGCCFSLHSIAQQSTKEVPVSNYRAVNWGLDEGLSESGVSDMIKDVNGFLWIATPFGLNRFDGYTFKKYFADETKKNKTIPGNNIIGLIEDSLHNIWIGTDKGLSCYDTRADTFRTISRGFSIPFWATKDEVFSWDYPESQLVAYNIHSAAKRTLASFAPSDTVGYGMSNQYAIFDGGSNSIWMEKGFRGTGGGLLQISLADGKRKKFDWLCKIPNHSHYSEGMRYDRKRNSIWIASPDGLVEFTLDDKQFHHINALNEFENLKNFWQWAGIDIDPGGRVWMGTTKGIIIYDPSNNSISLPFPNDSVQQKKVSKDNLFLYCDKDGMVWTGTFSLKGIYQILPFSPADKRYVADTGHAKHYYWPNGLTSSTVFNFIYAGQGTIWMGSSDGINIFDPKTGFFNLLRTKDLKGIKEGGKKYLLPLNVDTAHKKAWIYIDYDEPYFEMDMASRYCSPVLYEDSNGNRVPLLSVLAHHPQNKYPIPYKNGLIIVATLPGHQEILLVNGNDPVARKILSFPGEPINVNSISTNNDDLLFLKGPNDTNLTYAHHNNKWTLTHTPLDSIQWGKIFYNKTDQSYWIISEIQLIHYDKNFRIIHKYTNEDGMPGVQISGLAPDNKGNIWFNTARSIFHLNVKTGTVTQLAEKDGFLPEDLGSFDMRGKGDDGDLYITGDLGFDRISPDKFVASASSVYFESLKINQQIFPLSERTSHIQELSLKYFQNKIDLETGTIDYYSKGKGHIRYKLESNGKNASWQYAPAYYTVRYEGLPPGKYKLIVQASNAANEFNGPERVLLIHISPPFWQTWWFWVGTIILIGTIFYTIIRLRMKQKFRKQLERSENERQMAEMKQKATELEMQALRAQMNPHFIFNSLNSINRFILQNNREQASEFLTKFSKLVRMILQNSAVSLITLESELESLELYLNLEALRFDYHFDYKISVPGDMDISALQIPPLILQPYVENAIWHGLMHKEEKGHLNIDLSEENDHLYFKITDNGIGREKATALSSKSATKHKSMGLRITAHRIAMLQNSEKMESPVTINDLVNADSSAAGTEVIIKLPVIYD